MTWTRSRRSPVFLALTTLVACSVSGSDHGAASDSSVTSSTTTTTTTTKAAVVRDTSPPAPPKLTPFMHGDASVTWGKPLTMKLSSGKFSEAPGEEFGETESFFLDYTPDGTMKGEGLISFNAGRRGKDSYKIDDLRITGNGFWRYDTKAGQCDLAVSQASAAGVRGTITCTGDPKGPTTPIVFSATP